MYRLRGLRIRCRRRREPECRQLLDRPMKDLPLKQGVLVGAIARDKEIVIPDGNTCIHEGDHVVVVTKTTGTDDLMDILG